MKLQDALDASEYQSAFIEYDNYYTYVDRSLCDGEYEIVTGLMGRPEPFESQRVGDIDEMHRIIRAMNLDLDEWRTREV